MTESDLTLPFAVRLPAGWTAADPSGSGAPDAVFAAVRDATPGETFRSNVLIAMRPAHGEIDLMDLADAAAGRLASAVEALTVTDRSVLSDAEDPGIAQVLRVRAEGLDLVQSQVHLVITLSDAGDRLIVEITGTFPAELGDEARAEFAAIVDSVAVRPAVSD